jgi:hypothetical protein
VGVAARPRSGLEASANQTSKVRIALIRICRGGGGESLLYLDSRRRCADWFEASFVLPSGAASRSPLGRSGKPNHQGFGRTPISDLDIKTSTYIGLDDNQDHLNA